MKFSDGFTVNIGSTVSFNTRYGSVGTGVVTGFGRSRGASTVLVKANPDTTFGRFDRWALNGGGVHNRLEVEGLFGGELVR